MRSGVLRRHPGFFMGLALALGVGGGWRLLEYGYDVRGAVALGMGLIVMLAFLAETVIQQHRRQAEQSVERDEQ